MPKCSFNSHSYRGQCPQREFLLSYIRVYLYVKSTQSIWMHCVARRPADVYSCLTMDDQLWYDQSLCLRKKFNKKYWWEYAPRTSFIFETPNSCCFGAVKMLHPSTSILRATITNGQFGLQLMEPMWRTLFTIGSPWITKTKNKVSAYL